MTTTVIEGTTNNLRWVDTLPAGVTYVPGSAIITSPNGMTINGFSANLAGQVLTIAASSAVNPGTAGPPGIVDSDQFTIAYRVTVNPVPSGTVLTNDVDASADPGLEPVDAIRALMDARTPLEASMVESMASMAEALAELRRAAVKVFGPDAAKDVTGDDGSRWAEGLARIDSADVKLDGDAARVTYRATAARPPRTQPSLPPSTNDEKQPTPATDATATTAPATAP